VGLTYTSTLRNASGRGWTLIAASPAPSGSMVCRRRIKLSWYHSQIQMLGVPLGNDGFVSDFVEKKLLGHLLETVNRLVEFEDTQAAL